jgi:hypothetical protein
MVVRRSLEERLFEKTEWQGECLVWTGYVNEDGYGRFSEGGHQGRMVMVHRVAWELVHGPIPDGMRVLHSCDNPPCVLDEHLFLGTQADNVQDMLSKGRASGQSLTECKAGHPLSGDNLMTCPSLRHMRVCRTCHNRRRREGAARKRVRDLVAAVAIVVG